MFPLPIELQREIVESAIRTNHKDRVVKLNLSLVAHHFHFWVDRVFYESVEIKSSKQVDQFLSLVHSKPTGFFATTVKALSLDDPESVEMDGVLAACTGVQTFRCLTYGRSVHSTRLSGLALRRLCIDTGFAEILNSTVEPAWFSTLTHLDLGFPELLLDRQSASMLRRLPCLTNLALHHWMGRPLADAVYTDCPNLRVLVIFAGDTERDSAEYGDAPHVVLVGVDLQEDWDAGLFPGLSDFWFRAEIVVAARQARVEAQTSLQSEGLEISRVR
ncbi:hypothetical protein C8R46DRAFT_536850 [Mycena filopes]|nr:hypothetical protein C8R46DRAFT_536850 [Mycena filopes]